MGEWDRGRWAKGNEGGPQWTHPPCLSAVEVTQVGVGVPAWATRTLIDVHALEVDVHLHLAPRAANWQLGAQRGCGGNHYIIGQCCLSAGAGLHTSKADLRCR